MHVIEIVAKGGGGRGGGGRSSGSKSSSSGSSSKSSTPSTPKPGKSTAKPGTTIKTADGKEVQSSAKKPANTKYQNSKGIVGDNGYQPRFTNGYVAPPGSVVYYPQHSALDYLPWIYLFSQSSPQNDQAIIVQPDGQEVQAAPEAGGVDGMAIFNWIVLIFIFLAIIAGIVWGVNKLTRRKGTL